MSSKQRITFIMTFTIAIQLSFGLLLDIKSWSREFWVVWLIALLFTLATITCVEVFLSRNPKKVILPASSFFDVTTKREAPLTMGSHELVLASYEEESDLSWHTASEARERATLTMLRALYQQQYEIQEQNEWIRTNQ